MNLPPDLRAQAEALCPRDQIRFGRIARFLLARRSFFTRAGAVVESWRRYGARKLGPYARLAFRCHGRQQSLYLGRSQPLRKTVEALLAFLQKPARKSRWLRRAIRAARAAVRRSKHALDWQLRACGLWLKGTEFRGWRHVQAPINRSYLVAINYPRYHPNFARRIHPSLRCPYPIPGHGPPRRRKRRRASPGDMPMPSEDR